MHGKSVPLLSKVNFQTSKITWGDIIRGCREQKVKSADKVYAHYKVLEDVEM